MIVSIGPQWLVVVPRDQEELFARLRRSFADSEVAEVVLDRRLGDRRRALRNEAYDRRQSRDRRRAAGARETSPEARYRLIQETRGYRVFQAIQRVSADCPECRVAVEFELPRFAELPARLSVAVLHLPSRANGAQHVVEAEAFKATGRSLLACRMMARRRPGQYLSGLLDPLLAIPGRAAHA